MEIPTLKPVQGRSREELAKEVGGPKLAGRPQEASALPAPGRRYGAVVLAVVMMGF